VQTITFFNHKGGVGKTTMLFNVAIELGRLGKRVLMVDLDAQANLSAVSLEDEALERMYAPNEDGLTVAHAFAPMVSGAGDVAPPAAAEVRKDAVWLLPGDIRLSDFEGILPNAWTESLAGTERGFRITSAPFRMINEVADAISADYALIDLGPNVGALNRAVMMGAGYLILPMSSDLFSIQAIPSVGKSIDTWVTQWGIALQVAPALSFDVPQGTPRFLGYVSQQFNIYRGEATQAFQEWIERIPDRIEDKLMAPLRKHSVDGATLADPAASKGAQIGNLKNFHSLVPHAQEKRRAIFELEPDDVIRGAQITRARDSENGFRELADNIIERAPA
jgi:cellulose biosynthesis protein BcsQ